MDKHAIVIVTFNRLALLQGCLEAVWNQTHPYDLVVIVDNASTDGTKEYLQQFCDRSGTLIRREKKNRGGAGGFEAGLRAAYAAGADWFTLIDDDAFLRPDFLKEICRAIGEYGQEYDCFSGVPLTEGIRIGHRRRVSGHLIKREVPVPETEYEKPFFLCDIASFCGMVVSKRAVSRIGFPEGRYFLWYDDTEYSLRISKESPIMNWNKAVIDHRAPMESGSYVAGWKEYYGIRNRICMAKKHYGFLTVVRIVVRKAAKCFLTVLKLLASGKWTDAGKVMVLYRDGIIDGWCGKLGRHPVHRP